MKALIVEPKRVYQEILTEILHAHDIETLVAETGHQATQMLGDQHPELICSAMHLPDTTGLDLCAHLRSHLSGTHCPFILLTADRDPGLMDEAVGFGVTEVVRKSDFDCDTVVTMLHFTQCLAAHAETTSKGLPVFDSSMLNKVGIHPI